MIKKLLQIWILFIGSALITAQGASLSIDPLLQSVDAGELVFVDIVVSDLEPDIISAYDLSISFDNTIVNFSTINIDDAAFGFSISDFESTTAPGIISFNLASFELDADLDILQNDSFTLATLGFETLNNGGTSTLSFSHVDIVGANSSNITPSLGSASVRVNTITSVSEPSVLLLLGIGVFGIFSRKKPAV